MLIYITKLTLIIVISITILIELGLPLGGDGEIHWNEHWEFFVVMEVFYILTSIMATQIYTFIKTYQIYT